MENLKQYERPIIIIEYLDEGTWEGVPVSQTGEAQDGAYHLADLLSLEDEEMESYGNALQVIIDGANENNTFLHTLSTGEHIKCYVDDYNNC